MTDSILPLRLTGVSFEAGGRRLMHEIGIEFDAGPRTVVLGPNGAGKSLLLRLCHGLLQPTSGEISWRANGSTRLMQAMVFQRPIVLRRSAANNIAYALKLHKVPRAERPARIAEALDHTGLASRADRPAPALSVGEQQRLALARAWAIRPQVLFLDEPTANLDPAASKMVEDIVKALDNEGTKIVMTTHDIAQARRIADEVVFIHHGRLLEHAEAGAFFAGPATGDAAAFIEGELTA